MPPAALGHELLAWLLSAASSLSGLPPLPPDQVPAIVVATPAQLAALACEDEPGPCPAPVALYDTNRHRVLLSGTLDLDDTADLSFVVHELVHAMQHRAHGDAIFDGCPATLATEQAAYAAQNAFLAREGQLLRVGEMLRFMRCADEPPTAAAAAPADPSRAPGAPSPPAASAKPANGSVRLTLR